MPADFLRQIVNPIINSYVDRGLAPKIANELKKSIANLESKYKFDAFSGDPANLSLLLESSDFGELVSTFRSLGAEHILIEILERAREEYKDLHQVVKSIENALAKLAVVERVQTTETISLEDIIDTVKKHVPEERISVVKGAIRIRLDNNIEAKIRVLKNGIRLDFKINTLKKQELKVCFEKAMLFVEKISSV